MTEKQAPNKKKIIDWNKKKGNDAERISNRISGRELLKDTATQNNTVSPKTISQPNGKTLIKLKQKIKEIYDDDDEDEEETVPFFNISLLEDEPTEEERSKRQSEETLRINQQQQLTGKLNMIMDTALKAEKAGIPARLNAKDASLANSAEYNLKKLRRQTLKNKIEEPLGLKGELPEKELSLSLKGIRLAKDNLPNDSLDGFPAEKTAELVEKEDEQALAELILRKSGRRAGKKNLAEIAKGLNRFKDWQEPEIEEKEND